jgi:hypothetical protein
MPRIKSNASILTVNAVAYAWAYRHRWLVNREKGLQDISVSVSLEPGRTRELILDFSFVGFDLERPPSDTKVARGLESAVRSALAAGWDPESRGRAFRHDVAVVAPGSRPAGS